MAVFFMCLRQAYMTGLFSEIKLGEIDFSTNKLISEKVFWSCIQDLMELGYLFPKALKNQQIPTRVFLKFK